MQNQVPSAWSLRIGRRKRRDTLCLPQRDSGTRFPPPTFPQKRPKVVHMEMKRTMAVLAREQGPFFHSVRLEQVHLRQRQASPYCRDLLPAACPRKQVRSFSFATVIPNGFCLPADTSCATERRPRIALQNQRLSTRRVSHRKPPPLALLNTMDREKRVELALGTSPASASAVLATPTRGAFEFLPTELVSKVMKTGWFIVKECDQWSDFCGGRFSA